eukprot:CAMPEP_0185595024 /NCGR_PEP_ID=MMETSP0434-20130131/76961_1 /TAXON_ID=626734 ORGANISM="Favella taraikaensis, Strain Fe Narragansett Bay" /NCGR_SAMPLE_ID=MMETSP0434 /ASSEMBLY_ACC=CAM_ASM_000379 /LENGTH=31 /DNA_ID= /DNA_START= /DNA_END= /DNA_ORIENTATION=
MAWLCEKVWEPLMRKLTILTRDSASEAVLAT